MVGAALGENGRSLRLAAQIPGEQETGLRQEVTQYEPQVLPREESMLQMLYDDHQEGSG